MASRQTLVLKDPKSPAAEVYRSLRTNIKFLAFQKELKTIAITSARPNEGKSTVVSNLGITLAQAGSKVLILEGDLRNPSIHKNFKIPNSTGVVNILAEGVHYKNYVFHTEVENLDIISCGPKPPNPAELLSSSRMKSLLDDLKATYDYIILDTPPVVVVTDAAILASVCDGVLLVIASSETFIEGAAKAKELLQKVNANILGVVLNKVKVKRSDKYNSYYNYYDTSEKARKRK
jgi:capsular exopolysaccharide synthesis family protein